MHLTTTLTKQYIYELKCHVSESQMITVDNRLISKLEQWTNH